MCARYHSVLDAARLQQFIPAEAHNFTMLTINADTHPVMCRYQRPDDEKRMVVVLREEDYDAWLDAPAQRSMEFMRQCPPEEMICG
jgi:putative SOS response-associated peptidase YedK